MNKDLFERQLDEAYNAGRNALRNGLGCAIILNKKFMNSLPDWESKTSMTRIREMKRFKLMESYINGWHFENLMDVGMKEVLGV